MDGRSTGNYEKQVYFARDLFLRYDQDAMIRKFFRKNQIAFEE